MNPLRAAPDSLCFSNKNLAKDGKGVDHHNGVETNYEPGQITWMTNGMTKRNPVVTSLLFPGKFIRSAFQDIVSKHWALVDV